MKKPLDTGYISQIADQENLTAVEKLLLMLIAQYREPLQIDTAQLADMCSCSKLTLWRSFVILERDGWITIQREPGKVSFYGHGKRLKSLLTLRLARS